MNSPARNKGRRAMRGAALVEMAISIVLFLVLVFAIIEFALIIFDWSRVVEATRAATRFAVVNNSGVTLPTCRDATGAYQPNTSTITIPFNCTAATDACAIAKRVQDIVNLGLLDSSAASLKVTYKCSDTGFSLRPNSMAIYEVTVESQGFKHPLVVPKLLGLAATWTIPAFSTTRVSEDMKTQ